MLPRKPGQRSYVTGAFEDRNDDQLKDWCDERGIEIQLTAPYSPSQNGIAERMNRTLVEIARAMRISADLPENLWESAIRTRYHETVGVGSIHILSLMLSVEIDFEGFLVRLLDCVGFASGARFVALDVVSRNKNPVDWNDFTGF